MGGEDQLKPFQPYIDRQIEVTGYSREVMDASISKFVIEKRRVPRVNSVADKNTFNKIVRSIAIPAGDIEKVVTEYCSAHSVLPVAITNKGGEWIGYGGIKDSPLCKMFKIKNGKAKDIGVGQLLLKGCSSVRHLSNFDDYKFDSKLLVPGQRESLIHYLNSMIGYEMDEFRVREFLTQAIGGQKSISSYSGCFDVHHFLKVWEAGDGKVNALCFSQSIWSIIKRKGLVDKDIYPSGWHHLSKNVEKWSGKKEGNFSLLQFKWHPTKHILTVVEYLKSLPDTAQFNRNHLAIDSEFRYLDEIWTSPEKEYADYLQCFSELKKLSDIVSQTSSDDIKAALEITDNSRFSVTGDQINKYYYQQCDKAGLLRFVKDD